MDAQEKQRLSKNLKDLVSELNDTIRKLSAAGCECRMSKTEYGMIGSGKVETFTVEVFERIQ